MFPSSGRRIGLSFVAARGWRFGGLACGFLVMQIGGGSECCTPPMDSIENTNANTTANRNVNGNAPAVDCAVICKAVNDPPYIAAMATKLVLEDLTLDELRAIYCRAGEVALGFNCNDECEDLLDCVP